MTTVLPYQVAGVRYSVCEQGDLPEMTRLLAETFTRHDPPAVAVGLTPDEFEAFVQVISRSTDTHQLTIIARDTLSGEMAGALLTEDAASAPPDGMDRLSERFEPLFDLFGRLQGDRTEDTPIVPGESLHLFLLGVSDRFMRRGIAQHLVTACLANGSARGYRTAVTEATNLVSQHVFLKLGFVSRAQSSYADYRWQGVPVFASIAGHGGPMAMTRDIAPGQ